MKIIWNLNILDIIAVLVAVISLVVTILIALGTIGLSRKTEISNLHLEASARHLEKVLNENENQSHYLNALYEKMSEKSPTHTSP